MKIAVITLTRDRLEYSQHCFQKLHEFAGCEFDHLVLDQGSQDGTAKWLMRQNLAHVSLMRQNIGITRGLNELLLKLHGVGEYDVIVKFDNDCELTQPDTLRLVCELALEGDALLSPRILGLRNPPQAQGEFAIAGEAIIDIPQIGGIFLAAPARVYKRFSRYSTTNDDDDVQLCWWWRGHGGRCGYVKRLEANHYETTDGQWARYPGYFERRVLEGGRAI